MTASESFVEAAGTKIFIRERGAGPPVLLLHGFPQTSRCWDAVATILAEHHRVIAPDLPGYGKSERPSAYDVATLTSTTAALLDELGARGATVVGHDWGGAIAYRLPVDQPGAAERIAVVNSPYRSMDPLRAWYIGFLNLPILPELAFSLAGDALVERALLAGAARKEVYEPDAMEEYKGAYRSLERQRSAFAYYRTVSRSLAVRSIKSLASRTPLAPFVRGGGKSDRGSAIDVPTMIVWGMQDPALPPHLLDGIKRDIPHARIETLHDVGHFVPEEAPGTLAQLLLDFATKGDTSI